MERLLLKGNSKEDLKLIADLAIKLGIKAEYLSDDISYVNEPEALAEWGTLTAEQQHGILMGLEEADSKQTEDLGDVLREFRKKYE